MIYINYIGLKLLTITRRYSLLYNYKLKKVFNKNYIVGDDNVHYLVKEVADIAGISVRALHHYDQIGLLKPESVSPAGYRIYDEKDLEKLQQILFFKELGFSLQQTKDIIENPEFDRKKALITHKELLIEKKKRLENIIASVEHTIESIEGGISMDKEEMFKSFDMTSIEEHRKRYAEETEKKYGNTDAYKESLQKTSKYKKEDWARITAEQEEIYMDIIENMAKGPGAPEVQSAVEELRNYITKNYYSCTIEIFRGLADLYICDERFTKNIDKHKEGLAKFLSEAMHIYCDKNEGK